MNKAYTEEALKDAVEIMKGADRTSQLVHHNMRLAVENQKLREENEMLARDNAAHYRQHTALKAEHEKLTKEIQRRLKAENEGLTKDYEAELRMNDLHHITAYQMEAENEKLTKAYEVEMWKQQSQAIEKLQEENEQLTAQNEEFRIRLAEIADINAGKAILKLTSNLSGGCAPRVAPPQCGYARGVVGSLISAPTPTNKPKCIGCASHSEETEES